MFTLNNLSNFRGIKTQFLIIVLVLGIFFRFANLERKVYWHDEVYTSLRVSGYTKAEVIQQVFDGHEIGIEDLQKYQRFKPGSGLIDTFKSLAVEDSQHPPLYYMLLRFWVKWFGNSVTVIRSLTALISLLVFPCVYWLCLELFESSVVGWVAIILIAVSPVHVLFAQEAREYCLWTVTILLSSASLLRAMRLKTKSSWGVYAVTVSLGLYTFLFSGLVVIGHAIYVFISERFRLNKITTAYFIASLVGLLSFIPWLITIVIYSYNIRSTTDWALLRVPIESLVKSWLLNSSRIFLDFDFEYNNSSNYILVLIIPTLIVYSLYFVCKHSPKRVWLFISTLIGSTALSLILIDIFKGGIMSTVPRYLFPCYLGVQLAVAYLFFIHITHVIFPQRKWQLLLAVLLSSGVISCIVSLQAETWWIKNTSNNNPQIARTINQAVHPLLLSNSARTNLGNIISLSYLLEPKVRLRLTVEPNLPQIPNGFSDIFLFEGSSDELHLQLDNVKNYKIEPIFKELWRLKT